MKKIFNNLEKYVVAVLIFVLSASVATYVYASDTSEFQITINAGTLAVDIVNGSYVTVGSPAVVLDAATFSFSCGSTTGTFGSSTEQIYVTNPDAADNGWVVSLAASATTALWDSAGTSEEFDFNDASSSGCADGADADSVAGQLTVDPSGGTLAAGACASCDTTSVSLGSSDAFEQGVTDSITIVTGASGSDDIGDWTVRGVDLSQTLPAEQSAQGDYAIDMVLSIVAS